MKNLTRCICAALFAMAALLTFAPYVASGERHGRGVVTRLDLESPAFGWNAVRGKLKATFVSTPTGPGVWDVEATFEPTGLRIGFSDPSNPKSPRHIWVRVIGVAARSAPGVTGVPVDIVAPGLRLAEPGWPMGAVACRFTVDQSGTVSVQSYSLNGH